MTLPIMLAVVGLVWILTLVACGVSVRWTSRRLPARRVASCVLSSAAVVVGLAGLTKLSFVASRTTDGVVQWRFDSAWLFWASVACGLLSLVYALFYGWVASPPPPPSPTNPLQ